MNTVFDFFHAALPWIAFGLFLAVFFAGGERKDEQ